MNTWLRGDLKIEVLYPGEAPNHNWQVGFPRLSLVYLGSQRCDSNRIHISGFDLDIGSHTQTHACSSNWNSIFHIEPQTHFSFFFSLRLWFYYYYFISPYFEFMIYFWSPPSHLRVQIFATLLFSFEFYHFLSHNSHTHKYTNTKVKCMYLALLNTPLLFSSFYSIVLFSFVCKVSWIFNDYDYYFF